MKHGKNFASQFQHYTFTLNTDGVSPFKSSKWQLWPIYLTINELSPSERYKPEHVIFCGLFFGSEKPDFTLYLKPLVNDLNKITRQGEKLTDGTLFRGKLLNISMDLPARVC